MFGSKYDYHFIIKELAKAFKKQLNYSEENTDKYLTFSVLIEGVARINKNGEEIAKTTSYRLHFIDRLKFMASSLSHLVVNLAEGIRKIKFKYRHNDKNVKLN